jgi:hypothetical protein
MMIDDKKKKETSKTHAYYPPATRLALPLPPLPPGGLGPVGMALLETKWTSSDDSLKVRGLRFETCSKIIF